MLKNMNSEHSKIQGIDLFAGAGGMSVGAIAAGIDVRYAVEINKHAAATFSYNHLNTTLLTTDIRKVKPNHFPIMRKKTPTVIFGGPPCQGFSTSNQKNRTSENEKNWLFKDYLRIAKSLQPEWIVFENVKGLLETEGGFFVDSVIKGLEKIGYTTSIFVLNSADYGVPQRRNRLFIIGSLSGIALQPPSPTTKKHITVSQAITDLPHVKNGSTICEQPYARKQRSTYANELRKTLIVCSNNIVTNNADHIVERYQSIPPGGNWEDIPKKLMRNYTDISRCHTGIYRRLQPDQPSIVIGNFRKNMLIHPTCDRGLSVREAARLQSFHDEFKFFGSIGFQQQQVGNAVPPLLAKAVFKEIVSRS